ncbi:MAG TPA: hypothetical protein PKW90_05995, partial [Myxococcota bacterium]|nr:hypothetical protein [Myxococcota bacterium]
MHFRSLLPWLGLLSGACSTPTGKDSRSALLTEVVEDTGLPAGAEELPDIEIRPADIDFGSVQVGASASQTVKVLNHGAGTLE